MSDKPSFEGKANNLVSLKLSQLLIEDKPDKQGLTKAMVISTALLALFREELEEMRRSGIPYYGSTDAEKAAYRMFDEAYDTAINAIAERISK